MALMIRDMLESGVIKYGEKFRKAMEEGKWDLSLVDPEELAKSQACLSQQTHHGYGNRQHRDFAHFLYKQNPVCFPME